MSGTSKKEQELMQAGRVFGEGRRSPGAALVVRRSRRCSVHRQRLGWFLLALGLSVAPGSFVAASEGGRSGFSGAPQDSGGAVCSVCHTANGATAPGIGIVGPSRMNAGASQNFFVVMLGGPARTAGVGISVSDDAGTLEPFDQDLQIDKGELVHKHPKAFQGDLVTFVFRYIAPSYNTDVTLYAAGNSSNGALDIRGDAIASTRHSLRIENGAAQPPPRPPADKSADMTSRLFAQGLSQPTVITHAADERLFVAERAGAIRIVEPDGSVLPGAFLDIRGQVLSTASELGLLGLAFHPDFTANRFFYVYYTVAIGDGETRSRVSRFQATADGNRASADSETVLLEFFQPFANHNAGDLHFGPDGYLYIASGDGGSGGDPFSNGQNTSTLLGKLLRIDVDATSEEPDAAPDCNLLAGSGYRIPSGNAFDDGKGGAGCDEIYALGLRNPWRFTFDSVTGDLWIADVGQREVEEVNFIPAGSGGGANLGWDCFEGGEEFEPLGCRLDYLAPVHTYFHSASPGGCSITGGRVYRGSRYPLLQGQYFFTDFCQSSMRVLSGPDDGFAMRVVAPANELAGVSTFGEDSAGELYVAELASGNLFRLEPVLPEGDVDGDADVDFNDVVIIWFAIGEAVQAGDRRDVNQDGIITEADIALAGQNCSRAACAIR
jgi:glucose/arabinose dehydrogenase